MQYGFGAPSTRHQHRLDERSRAGARRQALVQALPTGIRAVLDLEEEEAQRYLDSIADRQRALGLVVTTEVRRGDTTAALADEAAEPGRRPDGPAYRLDAILWA